MASSGGSFKIEPGQAAGKRFLIVEARYYEEVADELLRGAEAALNTAGALFDRVTVPGALEIPAALAMALKGAPGKYHGYIALGCVIRGETTHYEIVSGESARALMDLALEHGIALGNGILTVDTMGGGAAAAALAMVALKQQLGA